MSTNPYEKYVAGEDVVRSLERTPRRIEQLVSSWPDAAFDRSYAPCKWTGRELLTHLAQSEIVFANRLRFGLAEDRYVIQSFDQDAWMRAEPKADGHSALAAYLGLRQMTLALCRLLTPEQRGRTFTHPEHGEVSVDWVMIFFAGHERHHLPQLEAIANPA